MSEMQTMVRTRVAIDGDDFFLVQGQDVDDVKRAIEAAVRGGGGFVDLLVVGERSVSILISSTTRVVISVDGVQLDHRDAVDHAEPYGGAYDLL